jgi:hypothetical protein
MTIQKRKGVPLNLVLDHWVLRKLFFYAERKFFMQVCFLIAQRFSILLKKKITSTIIFVTLINPLTKNK